MAGAKHNAPTTCQPISTSTMSGQRDRLRNVSLELLMVTLASLGQQVEIVVRPARRSRSAGITVAA
ncbi:hypothetical protein ABIC49_001183 [Burkholderia ambifaria]